MADDAVVCWDRDRGGVVGVTEDALLEDVHHVGLLNVHE